MLCFLAWMFTVFIALNMCETSVKYRTGRRNYLARGRHVLVPFALKFCHYIRPFHLSLMLHDVNLF